MTSSLDQELDSLAGKAYGAALGCHGELGLESERYRTRLLSITRKYLAESLTQGTALAFINKVHTDDLYLAVACARPSEAAWERLMLLYERFIRMVADGACSTPDEARETAASIPGHIFLPDASGRSRIGSYEGRSSLAVWLSAVINNKAIKSQRRTVDLEHLESALNVVDRDALDRVENGLRAGRYASLIKEALTTASDSLSERERLILTLAYQDGLQGAEIAKVVGVHPSTASRWLETDL